jgi:folate-binding protein YgfZ
MRQLNLALHFKILHVSGEQSTEFLQSQLTNDVKQIVEKQLQWQAYCSRQGLVQSIFGLWRDASDYYLLIANDLFEKTHELLKKYAVFSKVNVQQLPLNHITLELLSPTEKNIDWTITNFDQHSLQLSWRSDYDQDDDDFVVLRAALIEHRFPWLCANTSDCFRPHDINLPELEMINFKKGCFPGQEIIARMHYLGKAKKGFHVFHLNGCQDFLPGQIMYKENQAIGEIIDCVYLHDQTLLSTVVSHELKNSEGLFSNV